MYHFESFMMDDTVQVHVKFAHLCIMYLCIIMLTKVTEINNILLGLNEWMNVYTVYKVQLQGD